VSRSRLLKRMDHPGGVVTIVGGPVIGKTCLAESWMNSTLMSNRSMHRFWYRIDDTDQDIATFFQLFGEAAVKWAAPYPKLPAYSAEADLGAFTIAWVRALFRVTPRPAVAFIFDDVHRLVPDAPLLPVLGRLARVLGNEDRLILISRQEIPAQITDAARRQQRLIRITDLEIDESEFADFERSAASGDPLTRADFLAALRQSGKWMEGLPLLQLMGSPPNVVHDRLADVLAGFDDTERSALVATAYLQTGFDEDWARLGGPVAIAALSKIEATTGLVGRLQNHAIRKHDVVFEEIKDWAEANAPPQDLVSAQAETGRFLISQGAVLGGIRLLVAAKAIEETRTVVLDQASHLIDQAKNQELLAIIAALPPEEQSRPAIRLWAAYARLPFSPDEAAAELAAIRANLAPGLSVSERVLAINGEIYGALSTMRVDEHMRELIKAATTLTVQLTAVQEPMRSRLFIGRLVAILLGAPNHRGHAAIRKEAKDLLPDLTPESQLILGAALVTHLLWSEGDVEGARTLHRQIAEQALRSDAAHLPVMNWHLGAISLAFRDGDEHALQTALKALEDFAKDRGLDRRLAPGYWVATQAYAALGNHDAAASTLEKHLTLIHAMGALHQPEEHFLRSVVALGRGDFAIAAREAMAGWSIADRHGAIQARRRNAVVLAMSLAFARDASASTAIDEVAQAGRDTKNRIFLLHAALAAAALAHARRRWKDFAGAWSEVVRLVSSTGIRALTGINANAIGRLARDALLRRVDLETTRLFIQSWRLLPPAGEPAIPDWPYRLEVNCLGQQEIELLTYDERGQRASVPARSKTKSLLALLVSAEARTLPQETLIDELWPEAEAKDASDRLRQQIRDLRKLTTYEGVIFEDGRYRLNDRLVMTDVQRLEEAIQAFSDRRNALPQRIAAFDSAIRLYQGPILPDSESRLIAESREQLAAHLKVMGTAFLRALARQDATKAALRRRRLAKLV
jgi:LuxR family transcriptional regulator, maltose regulon positive regulatory protein